MKYITAYSIFLNVVAIVTSITLMVFSLNHYLDLKRYQYIYQIHKEWYQFSSSVTIIILSLSVGVWTSNLFFTKIFTNRIDIINYINTLELYVDSLTISLTLLNITHILIELTQNFPDDYNLILSQTLTLFILLLSARLPIFITIDYANHIDMKLSKLYMQNRSNPENHTYTPIRKPHIKLIYTQNNV